MSIFTQGEALVDDAKLFSELTQFLVGEIE